MKRNEGEILHGKQGPLLSSASIWAPRTLGEFISVLYTWSNLSYQEWVLRSCFHTPGPGTVVLRETHVCHV